LFCFEKAAAKLVAFGPRLFFSDNWNSLDFFILLIMAFDFHNILRAAEHAAGDDADCVACSGGEPEQEDAFMTVMRVLRATRLFKVRMHSIV
jgi:hypothetical protein